MSHQSSDRFVSGSHRDLFPDQVLHQGGGIEESDFESSGNRVGIQSCGVDDGRSQFQAGDGGVDGIEDGDLVAMR